MSPEVAAAMIAAGIDASEAVLVRTGSPKLARRAADKMMAKVYEDFQSGITTPRPSLRTFHPSRAPDAPRELDPASAAMLDQLVRDVGGDPTKPPKPIPPGNPYARSGSRHPARSGGTKDMSDYD